MTAPRPEVEAARDKVIEDALKWRKTCSRWDAQRVRKLMASVDALLAAEQAATPGVGPYTLASDFRATEVSGIRGPVGPGGSESVLSLGEAIALLNARAAPPAAAVESEYDSMMRRSHEHLPPTVIPEAGAAGVREAAKQAALAIIPISGVSNRADIADALVALVAAGARNG